jgi:hypothetical protein
VTGNEEVEQTNTRKEEILTRDAIRNSSQTNFKLRRDRKVCYREAVKKRAWCLRK